MGPKRHLPHKCRSRHLPRLQPHLLMGSYAEDLADLDYPYLSKRGFTCRNPCGSQHSTRFLRDLLDSIHLPDGRLPSQDSVRVPVASPILAKAHAALDVAANFVQTSLQAAMPSLHKSLTNYASSPLWTSSGQAPRRIGGAGATSDAAVPTFSLSSSEAMQHAAEGLPNPPRLFEVYTDDDVFAFSIPLGRSRMSTLPSEPPPMHARRASAARLVPNAAPTSALTPEAIASVWLSSLGLSTIKHVTQNVLPSIGSLTTAGAAHLGSDLSYWETSSAL
ncbi:hypothetical protein BJV78DRAFT_1361121 [Lactifluus subvellereus]|nr:hypothetical protein BJV78DRAFT_1361121 [Lactifluus subvellereus]